MSSPSGADDFLNAISDGPNLWRSLDVRILAVRREDRYFNLITRCELDPRPVSRVPRFPFTAGRSEVHAIQMVRSIEALSDLLRQMESGELQLGKRRISYRSGEIPRPGEATDRVSTYGNPRTSFSPRRSEYRQDVAWSELSVGASGDSLSRFLDQSRDVIDRLDHQLRTLPQPFDGVEGLTRMFLRDSFKFSDSRATSYSIAAPFLARLEREGSRLGERLRIRLTAGSAAARDACDVAYTGMSEDGQPLAGMVSVPKHAWSRRGTNWTCELSAPAPHATEVVVLLRIGRYCVDRLVLSNTAPAGQNAELEAYRTLDPALEILEEGYRGGTKNKAGGLESAVARLFTLCGFRVDRLSGDSRLSDAADFHAFAEEDRVALIVDTTLGAIDSQGKLGKLHTRSTDVASALPGWGIQAVVATAADRGKIAEQELRRAGTDRIVVLTSADYPELVELAESKRPVTQVLQFLRLRIPPPVEVSPARPWTGRS